MTISRYPSDMDHNYFNIQLDIINPIKNLFRKLGLKDVIR